MRFHHVIHDRAVTLETYGFDYYPVRDHQKQRGMLLGCNYAGIKTIRNGRVLHHFKWHSIRKITYERRMIILHTSADNVSEWIYMNTLTVINLVFGCILFHIQLLTLHSAFCI